MPSRPTRHRSDNGTAMIETAIVVLFITSLAIAVMELGIGWRTSISVSNAARAGARFESASGVADSADLLAVQAVSARLSSRSTFTINKIVIFKSTSAATGVPTNCLGATALSNGGSAADFCNVYSTSQVSQMVAGTAPASAFTGTCAVGGTRWDDSWCPSKRINDLYATGGPDYVGVYVEIRQSSITGAFGTFTLKDTAVMRIEPLAGTT